MTENKRFTIDVEETTQENALFENGKFVCFEDDTDEYLKKINEMSYENKQLKQSNKYLQEQLDDYSGVEIDNVELRDENEQLKTQLKELQEFKDNYDKNMELIHNSDYVQDFLNGNL